MVFGRGQAAYLELPAAVDDQGTVITEWEFTASELAVILNGGRLRVTILHTGVHQGVPLSPMKLEVIK